MKNKTAVVIGGHGGIGSTIAQQMALEGIKVYSSYHTTRNSDESSLINTFQMDVTDEVSVQKSLIDILKNQPIDILVFTVTSKIDNKAILSSQWSDYHKHLDVQIKGLLNLVGVLKDQFKAKHKTKIIVILTEYCVGKPPALVSHYVTAKYALLGFAKSLAVELAKYKCTVNMISPGMTSTNLIASLPAKLIEITAERNPLGRIANPIDVAKATLFLASDNSDYLNGANILVNGGEIMQ